MYPNLSDPGLCFSRMKPLRIPESTSPIPVAVLTAWLNIAHAADMTVMSIHLPNERKGLLVASALFGLIGAALIALNAPKPALHEQASTG